jgi:hypothetical protein
LSLSVFVIVVFVDIIVDFYRINLSKTKEKEKEKEKMNEKKTRGAAAPPCCCRHHPRRLPSVSSHWSLVIDIFRWPALLVVIVVTVVIVLLVPVHRCSVGPVGPIPSFLFRHHHLAVVGLGWAVLRRGGGAYVEYGPKKKKKCN